MKLLIANLGSTSIKLKLFDMADEQVCAQLHLERLGSPLSPLRYIDSQGQEYRSQVRTPDMDRGLQVALEYLTHPESGCLTTLSDLDGIGFKAVHAGDFYGPALVDENLIARMKRYNGAAPSHNPAYCQGMHFFQQMAPSVPQVAHFETGFHQSIPDYAWIYSLPYAWYQEFGIRRYGFHGSSLSYLAHRANGLVHHPPGGLRLIACHLGGSSSICAIHNGKSIDTSMGFTPQAGVPMGARSGDFDPFVIPYLTEEQGLSLNEIYDTLNTRSGLLGISGISADIRDLEQAAENGQPRALLALQAFAYAVKKYIGAYAASLGGLDLLVFSGGIGENAPQMRARICQGLEFLGIGLDTRLNDQCCGTEMLISEADTNIPVWVIPTHEELVVARATLQVLRERSTASPESMKG